MANPNATQNQLAKEANMKRRLLRKVLRVIGYKPFKTIRGQNLPSRRFGGREKERNPAKCTSK